MSILARKRNGPSSRKAGRFFISGLGIAQICSWGTLYYSFPQIAAAMNADLGWSGFDIHGALTVGLLLSGLAALPAGMLIDGGRGRLVMTAGSILAGLLLMAWSQVADIFWFYLIFAGIGTLHAATLYTAAFAVIAASFTAEDAKSPIITLTLWGGFAGTVFMPFIELLLQYSHWRHALIVLGLINIFVCAGIYSTLPGAIPITQQKQNHAKPSGGGSLWAVRQPVFIALLLTFALYAGVASAYKFHLYPILIHKQLGVTQIVILLALMGPAQVLGRMVMKLFASRAAITKTGILTATVFACAFAAMALLPSSFAIFALAIIALGAAGGAMTIVKAAAVPEFLTRRDYGAVNGVLNMPVAVIKAFAPTLAAVSRETTGDYELLLMVLSLAGAAMLVCFGFAIRLRIRNVREVPAIAPR